MALEPAEPPQHDAYAAWRIAGFRLYLPANFLVILGIQMQIIAVEWQVYDRTGSNLQMGFTGLAEFLPVLLFTPLGGHFADRYDRRRVVMISLLFLLLSSVGLFLISSWPKSETVVFRISQENITLDVLGIFACLFVGGAARAFHQPAKAALLPAIVPRPIFTNAVTWNMTTFQFGSIAGPALAGAMIWYFGGARFVYVCAALSSLAFILVLPLVKVTPHVPSTHAFNLDSLLAGVRFVFANPVILGAIALDMFAVLLGGATTLLPAYAKHIFEVDADKLGWMRAAPAVGALLMSLALAHRRPIQRAGRSLLWSIAGFGVFTIVFGLSRNFTASLACLFVIGCFDMVSVVIRHSLIQLSTPEEMRGRVSAVNGIFISASNELGAMESGTVAWLFERKNEPAFGPTMSVVLGGMGTIFVVGLMALTNGPLRRYGNSPRPAASE